MYSSLPICHTSTFKKIGSVFYFLRTVILLQTNKRTNELTNADEIITYLAEVIKSQSINQVELFVSTDTSFRLSFSLAAPSLSFRISQKGLKLRLPN